MNQILSHTRAARLVLEHAEAAGLPMPFTISATDYTVSLQVHTLDELADWSLYMETPASAGEYKDQVHHTVTGPFLEQVIEVTAITTQDAAVAS